MSIALKRNSILQIVKRLSSTMTSVSVESNLSHQETNKILESYIPPPIPKSVKESLGAYFKKSNGAAAELHLYRHSGFFDGATLNNAPNIDLKSAFDAVNLNKNSLKESSGNAKSHLQAALHSQNANSIDGKDFSTIATKLSSNGKIGSIRLVDIGNETNSTSSSSSSRFSSWFSNPIPRLINTIEIGTPIESKDEEKIVLLHGYGAGTGFFFQNLKALGQLPNSRLFALDWLGMGRSSRVPFNITSKQSKTVESRVEAAELFFIEALEDWRKKMSLEKMTLIGHSLGGYLSIAYSIKYPERVNRLVLVSPAGIPDSPAEIKRTSAPTKVAPDADNVALELQQSQDEVIGNKNQIKIDENTVNKVANISKNKGKNDVEERIQTIKSNSNSDSEEEKPKPRLNSRRRNIVQFLWEANLSPFAILRNSLFFGPMLAGGYTSRRFASLPEEDLRTLHQYCYNIFTSRGSSEYCLAHLLAPFGYARLPMVNRIANLNKNLPVTFIYGEKGIDWMDEKGGIDSIKNLSKNGNSFGRCFAIPHAGHHVYLDNPKAFDTLLNKVLLGKVDDAKK